MSHVASTALVADLKRSASSRSTLPQAWESAIIPKSGDAWAWKIRH